MDVRKWRALGVAFAITLTAGLAIAQQSSVGGISARPRFSSVGVGTTAPTDSGRLRLNSTVPVFSQRESDGAANNTLWQQYPNGEQFNAICAVNDAEAVETCAIVVNRTGTTLDSVALAATAVTVNGAAIATADGTTATVALTTGCTTTPNFDFRFAKSGNVVVIAQTNTPTCTSNAVTTAITAAVPAAYRPAVNQCVAYIAATDNGAGTVAAVQVQTDGDINWGEGAGASCSALGWTSSGTKTIPPWSGSYVLN